jgi:DNA-binding transcriptional LysR family regulator
MNYMTRVETRLLQYFVAVAEELHFGRAALALEISPPTLTQQTQKLESQLGARLLKRKGNTGVELTATGRRFLVDAREALRHVEQAFARAQQAERGELGRIELGFMTWVAGSGMLHNWMDPFEQAHPAIEINLHRTGPVAAINRMMHGELDVCFTRAPSKYPSGIRGFELYRQRFALALPRQHPLAKHDAIDLAKLAGERFINITPEIDIGFFGYTEAVARIGKFVPQVVKRDTEFITVLAYVAGGKGIAVVPELMKRMNFANVVFREIAGDPGALRVGRLRL